MDHLDLARTFLRDILDALARPGRDPRSERPGPAFRKGILKLDDLAEVRHLDYRDVMETGFDAVSSIGLTEHIGVANYPAYFRFLQSKLRTGGLLRFEEITRCASEVQDAIEANHLDHLLAIAYDPASKPGAADALLNELVENDGGVDAPTSPSRFRSRASREPNRKLT